jgi:maleate isomerase
VVSLSYQTAAPLDVGRLGANARQSRNILYDDGDHWRAKLGFDLLANEQTIEDDLVTMRPPGVGIHFARAPMNNRVEVATLAAMADGLATAAGQIVPNAGLNVICYACTSGSIVIGEETVIRELSRGAPGAKATTLTGVVEALRAIHARRIVVGTPYVDEINVLERKFLEEKGFEVLCLEGLNIQHDSDMVRVAPSFLLEFAKEIARPEADAIFLSCGALRSTRVIDAIEGATGKPAITSNQAMLWHCLRLAGLKDRIQGFGVLFRSN